MKKSSGRTMLRGVSLRTLFVLLVVVVTLCVVLEFNVPPSRLLTPLAGLTSAKETDTPTRKSSLRTASRIKTIPRGAGFSVAIEERHLAYLSSLNVEPHDKWIVVDDVSSGDHGQEGVGVPDGWRVVMVVVVGTGEEEEGEGDNNLARGCRAPGCVSLLARPDLTPTVLRGTGRGSARRLWWRNLAYLLALTRGARLLLDVDTAIVNPAPALAVLRFEEHREHGLMYNQTLLFNAYAHFGAWAAEPAALRGGKGGGGGGEGGGRGGGGGEGGGGGGGQRGEGEKASINGDSRMFFVRDFDRVLVKHGLSHHSPDLTATRREGEGEGGGGGGSGGGKGKEEGGSERGEGGTRTEEGGRETRGGEKEVASSSASTSSGSRGLRFDPSTPPVYVGQGTLCPAVPGASLYRRDALWALLLPCVTRDVTRCHLLRLLVQHALFRETDAFSAWHQIPDPDDDQDDDPIKETRPKTDGVLSTKETRSKSDDVPMTDETRPKPDGVLSNKETRQQHDGVFSLKETRLKDDGVFTAKKKLRRLKSKSEPRAWNAETLAMSVKDWRCGPDRALLDCFEDLAVHLRAEEVLDDDELDLTLSWVDAVHHLRVLQPPRVQRPWRGVRKTSEVRMVLGSFQTTLQQEGVEGARYLREELLRPWEERCDLGKDLLRHVESRWLRPTLSEVALISSFNDIKFFWANVPVLEALHRPFFRHVFYCVPDVGPLLADEDPRRRQLLSRLSLVEGFSDSWHLFYECAAAVADLNVPGVKGYLQAGDDTLLNTWNLLDLPRDSTWVYNHGSVFSSAQTSVKGNVWWSSGRVPWLRTMAGLERISGMAEKDILALEPLPNTAARLSPWLRSMVNEDVVNASSQTFFKTTTTFSTQRQQKKNLASSLMQKTLLGAEHWREPSGEDAVAFLKNYYQSHRMAGLVRKCAFDFFYFPQSSARSYVTISRYFRRHGVMDELALPAILLGVASAPRTHLVQGGSLWGRDRGNVAKFYNQTAFFLHPVKLSGWRKDEKLRPMMCAHFNRSISALKNEH